MKDSPIVESVLDPFGHLTDLIGPEVVVWIGYASWMGISQLNFFFMCFIFMINNNKEDGNYELFHMGCHLEWKLYHWGIYTHTYLSETGKTIRAAFTYSLHYSFFFSPNL